MRAAALAAILLLLAGAAQAQCVSGTHIFNASQNLSQIPGNHPNMMPNREDLDSAPLLRAAIAYVVGHIGNGCTELVVDPGSYYFETAIDSGIQPKKMAYAVVPAARGLTVDLKGSDLVFKESYYSAFYINQCTGCAFRNFTIDYKHLPFTQLEVMQVNKEDIIAVPEMPLAGQQPWLTPDQLLKQQPGPVQLLGFNTRGGFAQHDYAPWTLLAPLPPFDPSHPHRIVLGPTSKPQRLIRKHDVFIVAARGGGPAIFEQDGNGTRFESITIYTSGGPGIESDGSRAMMFDAIRVVPNDDQFRLVSTAAGGIELNNMSGPGTVVQNCTIIGAQDDSIAGNVTVPLVTATATSLDEIQVSVPSGSALPQDPVFFVNGTTGKTIGGPPTGKQYTLVPGTGSAFTLKPALNEKELSEFGTSVVYSWNQFAGEGNVIIRGNTVANSYLARGIAFAGVSGLEITDNDVNGTQQAGILVDANLATKEGATTSNGPANNTVITNNRLLSTNMGMSGVGPAMLGAIQIMGYSLHTKQLNQRAVVEGNTVGGTQRSGIWIGNVYGLSAANNSIMGFHAAGGDLGEGPHLNDGLLPYVHTGFSKAMLAWCVANPPGIVLDRTVFTMCHPDESQNK